MHILETNLHYKFNNSDLLITALTHRSAKKQNNQRLEYLGDAVLDCIIAEELYKQYPQDQEGRLSQYRSTLVNKQSLTEIAVSLQILPHLILGPGEKGQHKMTGSILADTVEAIIGAIYLDTDFATCKRCILLWFNSKLSQLTTAPDSHKDSKSVLQEWCQAQQILMPQYSIESVAGKEHDQTFKAKCQIDPIQKATFGQGKSRRKAEQHAAQIMLNQLLTLEVKHGK